MNKHHLSILAICAALSLSAFQRQTNEGQIEQQAKTRFDWYYFHFVGIRNCDESDRTKWQLTPYLLYILQPCNASQYGCKLIANEVEYVNGVIRPKQIYTEPGTNNPTTGVYVVSVSNFQN